MFDLSRCAINTDRLIDGVWYDLDLLEDGRLRAKPTQVDTGKPQVLVRAPGIAYQRAVDALKYDFKSRNPDKELSDFDIATIEGHSLIDGDVLLSWRNMQLDGSQLQFTKDLAKRMLADRRWDNLRGVVVAIADNRRVLLETLELKDQGNSLAGSTGSSSSPVQTGEQ